MPDLTRPIAPAAPLSRMVPENVVLPEDGLMVKVVGVALTLLVMVPPLPPVSASEAMA